jgi:hypothetical protein
MGKHTIKDKSGKPARTSKGERLFWSDRDGDSNPKHHQTVYRESKSLFGGNTTQIPDVELDGATSNWIHTLHHPRYLNARMVISSV